MKRIFAHSFAALAMLGVLTPSYALGQFFNMENPLVNQSAPEFTLKTLTSAAQSMTGVRNGQNAIVFFWATWCPHCRKQLKELNAAKEDLEGKGIKIILVDLGEDADTVRSYTEKNNIKLDVFLDEESSLSEPYGLIGVPTFYFINKDGMIKSVNHSIPENYEEIFSGRR